MKLKTRCERCGGKFGLFFWISKVDSKHICRDCNDKEQPKYLMEKIEALEEQLKEADNNLTEAEQIILDYQDRIYNDTDICSNMKAIAVLEKLKKDFEFGNSVSGYGGWELSEITDYIDQQINELKGEEQLCLKMTNLTKWKIF